MFCFQLGQRRDITILQEQQGLTLIELVSSKASSVNNFAVDCGICELQPTVSFAWQSMEGYVSISDLLATPKRKVSKNYSLISALLISSILSLLQFSS